MAMVSPSSESFPPPFFNSNAMPPKSPEPAFDKQKRRPSSSDSAVSDRKLAAALWLSSHRANLTASTRLSTFGFHHSTCEDPVSLTVDGHGRPSRTTKDNLSNLLGLNMWLLEQKQQSSTSVVSSFQADLEAVKAQIRGILVQQAAYEEEKDRLKKELADEKCRWHERTREVVTMAVKPLKQELEREKMSKAKLERKLQCLRRELSESKTSLTRALRDLERERRAREVTENMCEGLARKISEEQAQAEDLKRQCAEAREEMEEERKMLATADAWRQERVEMKLADADSELEAKKAAMDELRSEMEAFFHRESKKSSTGMGQSSSSASSVSRRDGEGSGAAFQAQKYFLQLLDEDFHSIEPKRRSAS